MKKFGLIGYPLTHSFSKKYFGDKFSREKIEGCSYDLFELPAIAQLPALLDDKDLVGLNVTIPYKEAVLQFVNELSDEAKTIGAVNCLHLKSGVVKGYNTDVYGFEVSLSKMLHTKPTVAFVLGTGGSSKAVSYVLNKLAIPFYQVSRVKGVNTIEYDDIEGLMQAGNLFINTTPLGMFPLVDSFPPVPYHKLNDSDLLFDLVYNPAETQFLKRGRAQGAITKNGLEMLELQAEKSWEIWNS